MIRARQIAAALVLVGTILPTVAKASADGGSEPENLLPTRFFAAAATPTPAPKKTTTVAQAPTPTPTPEPGEPEDPEFVFQDRPKRFPPFIWYEVSPERKSRFFMLGMLWWSGENPEREYHVLFPLFYHRQNKRTEGHSYVTLLGYLYKSPRGGAGYIFPVYWERQREAKGSDGTLYPEVLRVGIPPVGWYGRVGDNTTSYLFPLYFYNKREGRRVLATPFGGGWGTENDWQGLVLNFYWRSTHVGNYHYDAQVLFPFFWHIAYGAPGARGREDTWVVGPYFHRTRIAKKGVKNVTGVFPFFYRRTSPEGGATTVGPLFVHERKDENTSWLATPIGGFSKSPGRATVVFGPYIDQYSKGERFRAIVPIWFHGSGNTQYGRYSWNVVGPYFDRKRTYKNQDGTEDVELDRALLPLFYYGRRGADVRFFSPGVFFHRKENGNFWGLFGPFYRGWTDHTQTWALFPGIWYHNNTQTKGRGFGVLPFYYWHSEKRRATNIGFIPLFFHSSRIVEVDGKERRRRFQMLLPLYLYNEKPGHLTFLSPLYAQIRTPGERRIMAGWLYWEYKSKYRRSTTLLPVFHYKREGDHRFMFTPVGGFAEGPGYRTDVWGLFYHRREDALGINDYVLFPIFWNINHPGDRKFFLLPYYRIKQGSYHTEGFVPFWFHTSYPGASQTIVFPLFLWRHDKVEKTKTLFTPLGGYWKQEDPKAFRLLAPLVYLAKGPEKRSLVFFPLFWYDWDHGRQTLLVPPFYLRTDKKKQELTHTLIPLYYWQSKPEQTMFVALPGIFHVRDDKAKTTAILPLLFYWERDPYYSKGIAGPYLWSDRGPKDYSGAIFPLAYWNRKGSYFLFLSPLFLRREEGRRALTFIPGFGWASRWNSKGEVISRATLLGPLYLRYEVGREAKGEPKKVIAADVVLFPLFWHTHQPGRSVTALFPLFHVERRNEAWRFITPLGGGFKDPVADRTWWWVLNTVHYRHKDDARTVVIPFLYHMESKREFMIATPLFYHHRDRVLESSTTLAPLFYRHEDPYRKSWVAFPLAWHSERKDTGEKRGAFLPFAVWYGSKDRHWTLAPLLLSYYERRGEDYIGVYGLLGISTKFGDKKTKALIPIFRYQSQGENASFISLPFIWWLRHGKDTRAFVGVGYWNTETGTSVWPLWARFQSKQPDGTVVRSAEFTWPLPVYVRYKTPKKDVVVVAPFYRIARTDGSRVHGIAPFWSEELKPTRVIDGQRLPSEHNWSIFGDLLGYDRVGRYRRFTVLWGIHIPMKTLPANKRARASLEGGMELPPMFPSREATAEAPSAVPSL